jgi:hypothetical protein
MNVLLEVGILKIPEDFRPKSYYAPEIYTIAYAEID